MQRKNIKTALIDGYLDEPSALGVAPHISHPISAIPMGLCCMAAFRKR